MFGPLGRSLVFGFCEETSCSSIERCYVPLSALSTRKAGGGGAYQLLRALCGAGRDELPALPW